MERLAARRLCIFNTNFLFLLRRSKVSCNFILKISKKFSAFKFSPKLWDKPARTALGPFLRLWSTQTFSALGSFMTSFALVIWAYEQSGSALSTVGVLVLLSTDAFCVWCVGAGARLAAHSAWVSPWWRARRYRLRAVHGSANTRKPFLLPVRHRQRLRRRVFVPCPRLPRRCRLPLLPPQQAYPRAGSERQRLKS